MKTMSVRMVGRALLVVHDRPADLDDDDLVVEPLDVAQRLDEPGGLGDRLVNQVLPLQKEKGASLEFARSSVKKAAVVHPFKQPRRSPA